jgi:hypothetical protein
MDWLSFYSPEGGGGGEAEEAVNTIRSKRKKGEKVSKSIRKYKIWIGSNMVVMKVIVSGLLYCSKKGEARKETDRLCSEDKTGGGDGKAER